MTTENNAWLACSLRRFPAHSDIDFIFYDEPEYRGDCRSDNHDALKCVMTRRVIRLSLSEWERLHVAYLTNRSPTTIPPELSARGSVSTPGSL